MSNLIGGNESGSSLKLGRSVYGVEICHGIEVLKENEMISFHFIFREHERRK